MAKTSWFFFEMGLRRSALRERAGRRLFSEGIRQAKAVSECLVEPLTRYATSVSWLLAHTLVRGSWLSADALDPEAVANSAFLEFWLRKNRIHYPKSWMYTVIRRMLVREAAAARKASRSFEDLDEHDRAQLELRSWARGASFAVDWTSDSSPQLVRVRNAIQELPDALRELAEAYFVEACPREEVLCRLGLTREAFRQRLHRTRERLKRSLGTPQPLLAH